MFTSYSSLEFNFGLHHINVVELQPCPTKSVLTTTSLKLCSSLLPQQPEDHTVHRGDEDY